MITRLKLSTIEQGLPKYRSMLAGNDAYIPTSFESIATATGTGSSFTITFNNIPQTYSHLQLRVVGKITTTANPDFFSIRFNGVTTSTYANHRMTGDGSSVFAASNANNDKIADIGDAVGTTANIVGVSIIDIHDYTSTTKNKTVRSINGNDRNGAGRISLSSGFLNSTSAVTSISLIAGQNFDTNTVVALYGIRG